MIKKLVSLFALIVFTFFTFSCYTTKGRNIKTVEEMKGKKVKIRAVMKISGERIEFSKSNPGIVKGDKIIGIVDEDGKERHVSIPLSEVKWVSLWVKKIDQGKVSLVLVALIAVPIIATVALVIHLSSGV